MRRLKGFIIVNSIKKQKEVSGPGEKMSFRKTLLIKTSASLVVSLIAFSLSLIVANHGRIEKQKATAWKVAQVTLSNIDEIKGNLEIVTKYYDDFRNQYEELKTYQNKLDSVPDSLADEFIAYMQGWDIFAINRSPEQTFSSNYEIWDNINNVPLLRRIGNCYAYINSFLDLYNRDQAVIESLQKSLELDNLNNNRDRLAAILSSTVVKNYFLRSGSLSSSYHTLVERIATSNDQNKKDMSISDEQLSRLVGSKHWASSSEEDYIFVVGPEM